MFRRVLDRALGHPWVTDARRAPRGVAGGALVIGSGKMKRTPHHFTSVFLRRRDGGRDGREVTGWRMDAAWA